jgi:hypothetical protein
MLPAAVLDKVASTLAPRGVVIVVEWDEESFDEATSQWCFERLGAPEGGLLGRSRRAWRRLWP